MIGLSFLLLIVATPERIFFVEITEGADNGGDYLRIFPELALKLRIDSGVQLKGQEKGQEKGQPRGQLEKPWK